jgi:fatty acid desaturase
MSHSNEHGARSNTVWNARNRGLRRKLIQAGCHAPRPLYYAIWATTTFVAYFLSHFALLMNPIWWLRMPLLFIVGVSAAQAGFFAHDAGHGAVTKNRRISDFLGRAFMTLLGGQSWHHWSRVKHPAHHGYTNDPTRDPDMWVGVFAVYAESAHAKTGGFKLMTRYQHILLWPASLLWAFSIKRDSLVHATRNPRLVGWE